MSKFRIPIFLFSLLVCGCTITDAQVKPGIEVLAERDFDLLKGKRVGLVTNPTGVDSQLRSTIDILHEHVDLRALYGPEHGVTHTLKRHGLENGLLNVMIEVRNDLLPTQDACRGVADELYDLLTNALDRCADGESAEGIESAAEANR